MHSPVFFVCLFVRLFEGYCYWNLVRLLYSFKSLLFCIICYVLCRIWVILPWQPIFFLLQDYRQTHPEVTVLDPPDAIQRLHNRQSMLQAVADLNLSDSYGNFCAFCSNVGLPKISILLELWLTCFRLRVRLNYKRGNWNFVLSDAKGSGIDEFVQAKLGFPNSWLLKKMHHPSLMLLQILGWNYPLVCLMYRSN